MSEEILLTAKDLTRKYPVGRHLPGRQPSYVHAVDGVDLIIRKGETLGLVGESGCGKSTLGRLLVGLEQPDSGTISTELKPLDIQMIFQDSYASLNPRKRIRDILNYPMLYHGICTRQTVEKETTRLLDLVGLPESSKDRYAFEFSGGQRQRLGIAKALSLNPKLIICDEPVSALDVSIQAQILNLLKDIQEELKVSYLFIGHGLDAVEYISNRIAVMYLGAVVETGSALNLREEAVHPYTRALYGAAPVPDPELRDRKRLILQGELPSPVDIPTGCRFHTRCPYATEYCRTQVPPLYQSADGHEVACILGKEN